ncbi:MAG TPA: hypothetical protein VMW53_02835 [archaeon]|nr:hypothetical protein [archaeon]
MTNKNVFYIFGILQAITLGLIIFFILQDESRLNKTFDKWWPELESKLKNIPDVLTLQETWKSNPDNLLR